MQVPMDQAESALDMITHFVYDKPFDTAASDSQETQGHKSLVQQVGTAQKLRMALNEGDVMVS